MNERSLTIPVEADRPDSGRPHSGRPHSGRADAGKLDLGKTGAGRTVSALLQAPPSARACLVLAHGAGAGMTHPFMTRVAAGLAERDVATLRYQFPYMEAGSKRPDRPVLAMATVRAAVRAAARELPDVALFAGGKSFGGRMTSMAQAAAPLAGPGDATGGKVQMGDAQMGAGRVRGLVFLGFPLHPAGKPSIDRAQHLREIAIPMLFVGGTRDALADPTLLDAALQPLGDRATLFAVVDADHSFHVPARSGGNDAAVLVRILDEVASWIIARA